MMKKDQLKKTKISVTFVALIFMYIFSSCSVYKNGFIKSPFSVKDLSKVNSDSLQQEGELLNRETAQIISCFKPAPEKNHAVKPFYLNKLFENLNKHYQLNSCYHQLLYFSKNDTLKQFARQKLVESAANYHQLFQNEKNIRRIINRGDQAFQVEKKSLLHSQKFLWAVANRGLLKKQIPDKQDRHSKCRFISRECVDNSHECIYKIAGFCSEIFSRSIAHIHKKPEPEKNISRLMPHLQKWDIVIQKSPGRLTDKFIPGHFGHAAIYGGDSIFIEGIQKGVIASNPMHFAEGGSFLIIRLKNISEEKEKRIRRLLAGQIGKKYDFNFNVGSPDRLVCTELIYLVFEDFDWQTKKQAGVFTLSPDGIIRTAIASDQFYFPLYFNEKQLIENPDTEFLKSLLLIK